MLRFSLFGMPVGVDWWFWLSCVLLGGGISAQGPDDWIQVGVWTIVVFISILVHELGHAFAGKRFGANPSIRLHGFGGTTFLPGGYFNRGQSIFVSAAGPLAGLALGALILGLNVLIDNEPRLLRIAMAQGLYVNFVWTFINLLPIQPLDGGQILRELLGPRRIQITCWIGFVLAVVLCLWALSARLLFSALMLGMLAYYNFRQEPLEGGVIKG